MMMHGKEIILSEIEKEQGHEFRFPDVPDAIQN